MSIEEGQPAPDFTLSDADGKHVTLSALRGQPVVVYFYPKDETPGCTKEACAFRDIWADLQETGAAVLGISPDDAASHQRFRDRHELPFTLLSDPDKEVMSRYGAWGEKNMYGRKSMGVIRSTVLIDAEGVVRKHWRRVSKAEAHPHKVLEALQQLV
ncbi:thioredoxin-dependent thiol peroxidase [Halorhodospira sp. 9621]|uniref:thioredoxin-dependent thiol peroxidase n=1 Tax=Halorhodospira TaxID=85108 RepID=UPI001912CDE3|nr:MULTISPECIES: thioredoxin-dependent thiol peroxidase [Halorhodospira]MBK5935539.1 thioredoxin-dependent thiol peroxidase [Halorhodospira halophila]MBK5942429.1 thioredoxin-dependent thiol peroxidase [Halorhodospira halophila]MCG5528210.1 thioredoxin-dependent thiol peroxidase [Halorhodospira halophila]MCG5531978.1 thioredoxin-dependent thiol peroxidase [Halorhodospira sp. 9621]MCG5537630.1 thioredoxin-dependent thiol peroxidase [Halorhodospira sp. 9622]